MVLCAHPLSIRQGAGRGTHPAKLSKKWPRHRWWRPLLGLLLGVVTVIVAAVVVILVALAIEAVRGNPANLRDDSSLNADSPLGLLANNLVLATLIPAAMLAVWAAHRARVGWLASVVGRLRWSVLDGPFALSPRHRRRVWGGGIAIPLKRGRLR